MPCSSSTCRTKRFWRGWIVGAGINLGKIVRIDLEEAEAAPGVLGVVTYENAGKLAKAKAHTARILAGPEVEHYDQAVALVVAETFEQARAAEALDDAVDEGRDDLVLEQAPAHLGF